jgi:ATP-binding cassette subfamily C protein
VSARLGTIDLGVRALPAPPRQPSAPVDIRREIAACFMLVGAMSVVIQGALLLTPLLMMHFIDGVMRTRSLPTLYVLVGVIVVGVSFAGFLRYLRSMLLGILAERVGRRLQLRALIATVQVAVGGDRTAAALAMSDIADVRRLLGSSVTSDLFDVIIVPFALLFLWLLHPAVAFTALVLLLLQAFLVVLSYRATAGRSARASAATARANSEMTSWLDQRDAVRGLGLLPALLRRWAPSWLRAVEERDRAEARAKAFVGFVDFVGYLQRISIITVAAWLVVHDYISPGAKIAAVLMIGLTNAPLLAVLGRWRDWSQGIVAWKRLVALNARIASPEAVPPEPDAMTGVVFEDVSVRPPGTDLDLVSGLNLRMEPGEAWLLAGPNGIGKTTLLRSVVGLVAPATGRVLLDGQDTWRADRAGIGPRIGFLPQDLQLLDRSAVENIARFGEAATADVVAAARRAGAHDVIGRLHRGYDTPSGPAAGLSVGQQRLIAISRAIFGNPRLLVLDEPEAGLDQAALVRLREAVLAAKAAGSIVLLVSHDPRGWTGVADKVLRLERGGAWHVETPARKEPS